jgi:hypothetical protein
LLHTVPLSARQGFRLGGCCVSMGGNCPREASRLDLTRIRASCQ